MRSLVSTLGFASVFALAICSPASASQVTKQDLSGKKICGTAASYRHTPLEASTRAVGFPEASEQGP